MSFFWACRFLAVLTIYLCMYPMMTPGSNRMLFGRMEIECNIRFLEIEKSNTAYCFIIFMRCEHQTNFYFMFDNLTLAYLPNV